MTISSTNNKHVYNGNGVTRIWSYTWPIIDTTDIEIWVRYLDDSLVQITTGYSIDTNLQEVTYPTIVSGLPLVLTGEKIVLRRKIPLTQEVDLDNQGPLPSTTLEEEYDKLTLITQQHAEELNRCVKFPIDDNPTLDETTSYLDDVIDYANQAAASAAAAAASAGDASTSAAAAAVSEANAAQSALDAITAIQDFVDSFIDKNEVPAGLVDGVNVDFNLSLMPVNDVLKVFINGMKIPESKYTFSIPTITFNDPPAIGQTVEVSYITNGLSANPTVPSASYIPEYHTVTGPELAAKKFTLLHSPLVPSQATADMIGGSPQAYGADFTIINGNEFNWDTLGLDGQILLGTVMRIEYFY
jgi:hypothetical protein